MEHPQLLWVFQILFTLTIKRCLPYVQSKPIPFHFKLLPLVLFATGPGKKPLHSSFHFPLPYNSPGVFLFHSFALRRKCGGCLVLDTDVFLVLLCTYSHLGLKMITRHSIFTVKVHVSMINFQHWIVLHSYFHLVCHLLVLPFASSLSTYACKKRFPTKSLKSFPARREASKYTLFQIHLQISPAWEERISVNKWGMAPIPLG